MEANRAKLNKVYIVGTVAEVDVNEHKTKDGSKNFISGKVVVKCVIDNKDNLVEVRVIANELNKDGSANKMFTSYKALPGMLGKRVRVTGELNDESMFTDDNTLRHFNTIRGTFFNSARNDEVDACTFEYSGFVTKGIIERKNKDDELIGFRIEIAQANYNNTNMKNIRFDVNKNDINIAQAIESNYLVGSTVKIQGKISYDTRTETREEEVSFGEANKKTIVYTDKVYRIVGGSEPYDDGAPETYAAEEIKALVEAYKTADAEKIEKSKTVEEPVSAAGKAMGGLISSSLI